MAGADVQGSKKVVEYAGTDLPEPRRGGPWTIILLVMAAVAVCTCVRIEVLNAQAGNYLPRDFTTDPGQWRAAWLTTEPRWRAIMARKTNDATWLARPLTAAEQAAQLAKLRPQLANNRLREVVESWGLGQYPLVVLLLVALPLAFFRQEDRRWRVAVGAAFALIVACGALMLYRGYFASLGM
jgi:hypothetical protein